MEFEIIDGDLKIAACGIGDLTFNLAQQMLSQWEPKATLQELTVFMMTNADNPWYGWVIINRDHNSYDLLLDMARAVLECDQKRLKQLVDRTPKGLEETTEILRNEKRRRETANLIKQAGYIPLSENALRVCDSLARQYMNNEKCDLSFALVQAFTCGIIQGKRMERARKKANREGTKRKPRRIA